MCFADRGQEISQGRVMSCSGLAALTKVTIFIELDATLISGDVVQNKTVPNIAADGGASGYGSRYWINRGAERAAFFQTRNAQR